MADEQPIKRNWRFQDLTGQRFGRLIVLEFSHIRKKHTMWRCQCDCSMIIVTGTANLKSGMSTSCGCYRRENISRIKGTHRMSNSPEYESWMHAKSRCFNSNNRDFPEWGGRGITMSDAWINSFETFLADMGPRPPDTMLDRIDNNGPYTGPCPEYPQGNCRWATRLEQNNNRRHKRWFRKPKPL